MKRNIYLIGILFILFCFYKGYSNDTKGYGKDTLNIQCSPELYSLTTALADEYNLLSKSLNINVIKIEDQQNFNSKNLSIITDEYFGKTNPQWKMTIAHDAIVAIVHAKNPLLHEINAKGLSAEKFSSLFSNTKDLNWGTIMDNGKNFPVHCYLNANENIIKGIAGYTKTDPLKISGIQVETSEELISALEKNIYAIGFCKLKDLRKPGANEWIENINVIPLDKNGNGRLDNFENIYSNPDAFARGVWIGKYPSSLCGNIYVAYATKPSDVNALAFLTWILSDGGKLLNSNGYSDLASNERQSNINILSTDKVTVALVGNTNATYRWLIILAGLVFCGIVIILISNVLSRKKAESTDGMLRLTPVLNEVTLSIPNGLYFDKTHTWTYMERDGMVKIGIDDFLQHITGTLTSVKMKEPGETVRKGEKIFSIIRFGKRLDIYAPVSGIIKEQNQDLHNNSALLNSSPYSDGWVYLIEPKNWLREIQFLYMGEKYKEWLKEEFTRLRDFFSAHVKANDFAYEKIVLQDGGELSDKILANLGPKVWDDFQTKFLDASK